jgi:hypothetical protein
MSRLSISYAEAPERPEPGSALGRALWTAFCWVAILSAVFVTYAELTR